MDINVFSDEQLAGQRIMAGFDGTTLNTDLKDMIGRLKIGGIILFSRNIESPGQLKALCTSVQAYAADCGQPPLFIAIDQEGGQVARLKAPFTRFPGNPAMTGPDDAGHFARITASELKEVGINMNMAPVMDVAPKNMDSIMARRVFGHDPARVSEMGCRVIEVMQANGLMAVAKHFPGIGRTTLDSHIDLPCLEASAMSQMESFDLLPFKAAVSQGVAGIMLSHILYRQMDSQWPASLSLFIAKTLLRDRMGFNGLVVTDDLDMGAIEKHYGIRSSLKQILAADIDITLICRKGPNIETAFEYFLKHLNRQRNTASLQRIITLKHAYLRFPELT